MQTKFGESAAFPKWTMKGLLRFLELSKICLKRRQGIQFMELEVLRREMDLRERLCRNNTKRKLESDWEPNEIKDGETSTKSRRSWRRRRIWRIFWQH